MPRAKPAPAVAARPPSRSRFQEGSMNDRASAVPPVHFLANANNSTSTSPNAAIFQPLDSIAATPILPFSITPARAPPPKKETLLGRVWGRLRRKPDEPAPAAKTDKPDDRPSREEIMANYEQLVQSGFFSSHAITSVRQPPPGKPTWPLAQGSTTEAPATVAPAQRTTRGTKRPLASPEPEQETSTLTPRKLRKSASAVRITRRAGNGNGTGSGTRSFSTTAAPPRVVPAEEVPDWVPSRRNVSAAQPPKVKTVGEPRQQAPEQRRVLRPRRSAEPLGVAKANRGIPKVPKVPEKFTYGEDRENHGPWRGLRRGAKA